MQLFKKQADSIKGATARLNIWEGSVRAGKTIASIIAWIRYIGNAPKGNLIMTGKTDRSIRRNVIEIMQILIGRDMVYYPGKGEIHLWGRRIFVYGAADERAEGKIRGLTLAGAYCDEISLYPESFFKMLISRLSIDGAKLFGTTNPENPYHWLKVDFLDRTGVIDLNSFHFTIDDNIFLPPAYVANLKKEYVGIWYKRFILGLWAAAEGAIYDFFTEKNIIKRVNYPHADAHVVGVDYGTQNPCTFLLYGLQNIPKPNTPKIWSMREYYWWGKQRQRQKTDGEYSTDFKKFLGGIKPIGIYIDPSAASFIAQLKKDGIFNIKDVNTDVMNGLRVQATMLKTGAYAVGADCPETIKEYYGYTWDAKAAQRGEDKPLKMYDHTKDNERYVLYTRYGKKYVDYAKLTTL